MNLRKNAQSSDDMQSICIVQVLYVAWNSSWPSNTNDQETSLNTILSSSAAFSCFPTRQSLLRRRGTRLVSYAVRIRSSSSSLAPTGGEGTRVKRPRFYANFCVGVFVGRRIRVSSGYPSFRPRREINNGNATPRDSVYLASVLFA